MKFYYAVFELNNNAVEVYFPDIQNAVTFANTMEEAYAMAIDVLAATLVDYVELPEKTLFLDLKELNTAIIMAVPVNEKLLDSYKDKIQQRRYE